METLKLYDMNHTTFCIRSIIYKKEKLVNASYQKKNICTFRSFFLLFSIFLFLLALFFQDFLMLVSVGFKILDFFLE